MYDDGPRLIRNTEIFWFWMWALAFEPYPLDAGKVMGITDSLSIQA